MPSQPAHAIAKAAGILAAHDDAAVAGVGRDLQGWLIGQGPDDLAEALGAHRDRSRLDSADLHQRDQLIRALAAIHFAGPSVAARSDRLHAALNRYEATAWRRDQWAEKNPHPVGSRQADMWAVFAISGRVPSARTIRRLLAIAF